jgi:hypothetical protein
MKAADSHLRLMAAYGSGQFLKPGEEEITKPRQGGEGQNRQRGQSGNQKSSSGPAPREKMPLD